MVWLFVRLLTFILPRSKATQCWLFSRCNIKALQRGSSPMLFVIACNVVRILIALILFIDNETWSLIDWRIGFILSTGDSSFFGRWIYLLRLNHGCCWITKGYGCFAINLLAVRVVWLHKLLHLAVWCTYLHSCWRQNASWLPAACSLWIVFLSIRLLRLWLFHCNGVLFSLYWPTRVLTRLLHPLLVK